MPSSDPPIVLKVTGVLKPTHAASTFWTTDPLVAAPYLENPTTKPVWLGAVLIGPNELSELQTALSGAIVTMSWEYPLLAAASPRHRRPGCWPR